MSEYIKREAVEKAIDSVYTDLYPDYVPNSIAAFRECLLIDIGIIPASDVQPVDRWISVDEALPIYDGLVLAVDKNNTIRLGIYTDLGWTSQFGNPMVAHITHWRPLPEPPKDGDNNA